MKKFRGIEYLKKTEEALQRASISLYEISVKIDEPKSTLYKIFNPDKYRYSEEKTMLILNKINEYLDCQDDTIKPSPETTVPVNPELSLKLFKLGLDSKVFTPEEKLQLALAHKKLTESKNQNQNNHE